MFAQGASRAQNDAKIDETRTPGRLEKGLENIIKKQTEYLQKQPSKRVPWKVIFFMILGVWAQMCPRVVPRTLPGTLQGVPRTLPGTLQGEISSKKVPGVR